MFCTDEKTNIVRRQEHFYISFADKLLQGEIKNIDYKGLSATSFFQNIPNCKVTFISLLEDKSKTSHRNMQAGFTNSFKKIFDKYNLKTNEQVKIKIIDVNSTIATLIEKNTCINQDIDALLVKHQEI